MVLTGLADAGAPIRVRLVPEEAGLARATPAWVAGFADASRDLVVLFPQRIGSYPYGSIEAVLQHEVAHVLTARAAGGRPVPRWFNEGLASAAERTWGLGARSRFAWELVAGGRLTAAQLEGLFAAGPRDVARAYALSDALVRHLLERYGPYAPARILSVMARGAPFEIALYAATGASVDAVVAGFWARHDVWKSWVSFAGQPFVQWSVITLLALAAIWPSGATGAGAASAGCSGSWRSSRTADTEERVLVEAIEQPVSVSGGVRPATTALRCSSLSATIRRGRVGSSAGSPADRAGT